MIIQQFPDKNQRQYESGRKSFTRKSRKVYVGYIESKKGQLFIILAEVQTEFYFLFC